MLQEQDIEGIKAKVTQARMFVEASKGILELAENNGDQEVIDEAKILVERTKKKLKDYKDLLNVIETTKKKYEDGSINHISERENMFILAFKSAITSLGVEHTRDNIVKKTVADIKYPDEFINEDNIYRMFDLAIEELKAEGYEI